MKLIYLLEVNLCPLGEVVLEVKVIPAVEVNHPFEAVYPFEDVHLPEVEVVYIA